MSENGQPIADGEVVLFGPQGIDGHLVWGFGGTAIGEGPGATEPAAGFVGDRGHGSLAVRQLEDLIHAAQRRGSCHARGLGDGVHGRRRQSAGVGEEVARSGRDDDQVGTEVVVVGGDAVLDADPESGQQQHEHQGEPDPGGSGGGAERMRREKPAGDPDRGFNPGLHVAHFRLPSVARRSCYLWP